MSGSIKLTSIVAASILLIACGGSGGSGDGSSTDTPDGNNPGTGNTPDNGNTPGTTPPNTNNPVLLFSAEGDINQGMELWLTDGTEAGTIAVKDINVSGNSSPKNFVKAGNQWFFSASESTYGQELWVTDGTETGTRLVKDIHPSGSSHPEYITALNDKVFFRANDGMNGSELWVSDGTEAGTQQVKDIYQGSSGSGASYITAFNNKVYFAARDADSLGNELWESDGTEAGTQITVRLSPNKVPGVNLYEGSIPTLLTVSNGRLYFTAKNNTRSNQSEPVNLEPHTILANGTPSAVGEVRASIFGSFPTEYTEANFATGKTTVFTANSTGASEEIWLHNGNSVTKLTNYNSGSARPRLLTAAGDKLFFAVESSDKGYELAMTQGVANDAVVVKDIVAGTGGSAIRNINALGDKVVFVAKDENDSTQLWVSDGTESGTFDILTLTNGESMEQFIRLGDYILFSADDDTHGQELWVTDGTANGTKLLKDVNNGSTGSNPTFLTNSPDQPSA